MHVPVAGWQTPGSWHFAVGAGHTVATAPVHEPALHFAPVEHLLLALSQDSPCLGVDWQAPAPSHVPSVPHTLLAFVHALCATLPATMGRHCPAAPPVKGAPEQALQPVHAASQQTPSAVMFDKHSKPFVAAVPFVPFAVQVPLVPLVILQ